MPYLDPSTAAARDFKYYAAAIAADKSMTTERPGFATDGHEKLTRQIVVRGAGDLVVTDALGNDTTFAIAAGDLPWIETIGVKTIKASTATKVLVKW